MSNGTSSADSGQEIVNLFADYFIDSYSKLNAPHTTPPNSINNTLLLNSLIITNSEVFNMISSLNLFSSIGPDRVPALFLFNCRFILTPILTKIFNESIQSGQYPSL